MTLYFSLCGFRVAQLPLLLTMWWNNWPLSLIDCCHGDNIENRCKSLSAYYYWMYKKRQQKNKVCIYCVQMLINKKYGKVEKLHTSIFSDWACLCGCLTKSGCDHDNTLQSTRGQTSWAELQEHETQQQRRHRAALRLGRAISSCQEFSLLVFCYLNSSCLSGMHTGGKSPLDSGFSTSCVKIYLCSNPEGRQWFLIWKAAVTRCVFKKYAC